MEEIERLEQIIRERDKEIEALKNALIQFQMNRAGIRVTEPNSEFQIQEGSHLSALNWINSL